MRVFGGVVLVFAGRRQGFGLTGGKAARLRIEPANTIGRRAAAPFSVRRSPIRSPVAMSRTITKPGGVPTDRAQRGKVGLVGAQVNVSTVSAGVTRRNPTKHF